MPADVPETDLPLDQGQRFLVVVAQRQLFSSTALLFQLVLPPLFPILKDELGVRGGRLYERRDGGYELTRPPAT